MLWIPFVMICFDFVVICSLSIYYHVLVLSMFGKIFLGPFFWDMTIDQLKHPKPTSEDICLNSRVL